MYSTGLFLNLHNHLFVPYLLVVIASCQTQIKLLQFTSSCIEFTFLVLLIEFEVFFQKNVQFIRLSFYW